MSTENKRHTLDIQGEDQERVPCTEINQRSYHYPSPTAAQRERKGLWFISEYVVGVALDDLPQSIRPAAVAKANKFIKEVVLPQLAGLRSNCNGALTGDIIPPRRVAERQPSSIWNCMKMPTKVFTFCHNDLGEQNILCDQETGDVLSIIDWEYAGYYDHGFEGLLWQKPHNEIIHDEEEVDKLASRLTDPVIGIQCTITYDEST